MNTNRRQFFKQAAVAAGAVCAAPLAVATSPEVIPPPTTVHNVVVMWLDKLNKNGHIYAQGSFVPPGIVPLHSERAAQSSKTPDVKTVIGVGVNPRVKCGALIYDLVLPHPHAAPKLPVRTYGHGVAEISSGQITDYLLEGLMFTETPA